ncbi:MAG: alpha/beta fold hydrolase [Chloroflexia bacterium]|nr:alpha/beta fold hydrolase [Chloroflexia bacterium]
MNQVFYADPEHQPFAFPGGSSRALLIHGFLGSPRELRPLARELADAGVTARGVLLPGFGEDISQLKHVRADDWLGAARRAWVETRRDAEHTTLIGFSMGGAVALCLATEAGLAPDRLILLAPHWKFADRRTVVLPIAKYLIREFKPFGRVDFDNPDIRRMFADMAPGADLDDPEVRHQLRDSATIPTHALDELRRIGVSAAKAAPRVSVPTTILQGLQDTTSLPAYTRALAARMGADLLEFPGDHLIVDPGKPSWATVRDAIVRLATAANPV